ncbi:unnamed protein product, partial [Gadus morhua 'NCC']
WLMDEVALYYFQSSGCGGNAFSRRLVILSDPLGSVEDIRDFRSTGQRRRHTAGARAATGVSAGSSFRLYLLIHRTVQ